MKKLMIEFALVLICSCGLTAVIILQLKAGGALNNDVQVVETVESMVEVEESPMIHHTAKPSIPQVGYPMAPPALEDEYLDLDITETQEARDDIMMIIDSNKRRY